MQQKIDSSPHYHPKEDDYVSPPPKARDAIEGTAPSEDHVSHISEIKTTIAEFRTHHWAELSHMSAQERQEVLANMRGNLEERFFAEVGGVKGVATQEQFQDLLAHKEDRPEEWNKFMDRLWEHSKETTHIGGSHLSEHVQDIGDSEAHHNALHHAIAPGNLPVEHATQSPHLMFHEKDTGVTPKGLEGALANSADDLLASQAPARLAQHLANQHSTLAEQYRRIMSFFDHRSHVKYTLDTPEGPLVITKPGDAVIVMKIPGDSVPVRFLNNPLTSVHGKEALKALREVFEQVQDQPLKKAA